MNCPVCNSETKVMDSARGCEAVYRRRKCLQCDKLIFTVEIEADAFEVRNTMRKIKESNYGGHKKHKRSLLPSMVQQMSEQGQERA